MKKNEVVIKKVTRPLVVKMATKERAEIADELADLVEEKDHTEQRKKEVAGEFNVMLEGIDDKISDRARSIREGGHQAQVECRLEIFLVTNTIRITRLDTKEVVEERAMSSAERNDALQPELPVQDGKTAAAEGGANKDDDQVEAAGVKKSKKKRVKNGKASKREIGPTGGAT